MNAFTIIGIATVATVVTCLVWVIIYLTVWRYAGYVVGGYRLRRYMMTEGADRIPHRNVWLWAFDNWSDFDGDAWFQNWDGKKVYLYGWHKVEDDNFYGDNE